MTLQLLAEVGFHWGNRDAILTVLIIALVVVVLVVGLIMAAVLFSLTLVTWLLTRSATNGRSAVLWSSHLGRAGIALMVATFVVGGCGAITLFSLEVQQGGLVSFAIPLEPDEQFDDHPQVQKNRTLTIAAGILELLLAAAIGSGSVLAMSRALRAHEGA